MADQPKLGLDWVCGLPRLGPGDTAASKGGCPALPVCAEVESSREALNALAGALLSCEAAEALSWSCAGGTLMTSAASEDLGVMTGGVLNSGRAGVSMTGSRPSSLHLSICNRGKLEEGGCKPCRAGQRGHIT